MHAFSRLGYSRVAPALVLQTTDHHWSGAFRYRVRATAQGRRRSPPAHSYFGRCTVIRGTHRAAPTLPVRSLALELARGETRESGRLRLAPMISNVLFDLNFR